MISQEIRRKFLAYFKKHGHTVVPSSPVVPHDDPTLLFTNAGMNQFKDLFLGKAKRDYTTATTAQKCIRVGGKHNDLDNVGHTSRHLTFFEMLGNFSFGDYFKEKAITYAWEVTTEIFQYDPDKLWITIFQDDDEAFEIWKKIVPEKRIVRMGEKDNFWAMGDTGPCGPCSELYYDRGPKYGDAPSIKEDTTGERYLEFWNLVFMQFNRDSSGKMTPLPKPSIDTGGGLERIVSLKMEVDSVYGTDILRSLIAQIEEVSGKSYDEKEADPAFHVIADHIRSLSFAIADGVQPSNVDRGYVLRKILRRAVRYGRMLGMQEPFLARVLPRLISTMGSDYPELKTAEARIAEVLTVEEEAFFRTLKRGGNILSTVTEHAKKRPQKEITGEEAFKLKDTYGLPIEEILLIAKDAHLTVNLDAYMILEEKARELSRSAHVTHTQVVEDNLYQEFLKKHPATLFTGYQEHTAEAKILGLLVDGAFVKAITPGQEGQIILDRTPFYAEKGGQVGDAGIIEGKAGRFVVDACQNPYGGIIVHVGKCERETMHVGDTVRAAIDVEKRGRIQNNHTATHLLHWALQKVLGPHIRQAGSLVEESRLRFDFSHHKSLSKEELLQIEQLVNAMIREDKPVQAYELSYDEAQNRADIKQFFGEKYGAVVRVIDIETSKELCGGTHTSRTGTIGYFRIAKEGSIAAGTRRIEAVTGDAADAFVRHQENEHISKMAALQEEIKQLHKQIKDVRRVQLREMASDLLQKTMYVGSTALLAAIVPVQSDELALLLEDIGPRLNNGVILLAMRSSDKCQMVIKVSPELVKKGVQAVQIIKEIAPLIGGSGGGRPDSAQAGGKTPEGLESAIDQVKSILNRA